MSKFRLHVDTPNDVEFKMISDNVTTIKKTGGTGTDDYEELTNLPKLDGATFIGNMHEKDPTISDWAKETTRPAYSASDVGALGENDIEEIGTTELENLWEGL